MDDKRIVELFLARAETAISEVAKKYGRYCRYISMHLLGNEQDAEEIENDTISYFLALNDAANSTTSLPEPLVGSVVPSKNFCVLLSRAIAVR